jgi:N-acetylglutamate synthase-like GNAT family acetyltransferase
VEKIMALGFRDIEVVRADPEDLPTDLSALHQQTVAPGAEQILRVAKLNEVIIACYAMHGPVAESTDYVLQMVMVQQEYRQQKVGRWLIGHAIGVAESKGGRGLTVPYDAHQNFFKVLGFNPDSASGGWRFQMIQE